MKKDRKFCQYRLYTLFFIPLCMIILFPIFIRGNSLIANADGYNQAFPVFCYARQYWMNILKGEFQFFDFSIGLGEDIISTLSVHGLYDIIQVPVSLLFPQNMQEMAYAVSLIIKMYLSGIVFLIYINKHVKDSKLSAAGALLYAFNVYGLFWGTYFPTFLMPYICLPLILHGMDMIASEKKRISLFLIGGVFVQGLNGYYFLYMIVLIAILYYCSMLGVWVIEKGCKSINEVAVITLHVFLNGVIGLGLSAVVFIPSMISLFSSSREYGTGIDWRLLQNSSELLKTFSNLLVSNVYSSTATLAVVVFGGWLLYILSNGGNKRLKYFSLLMFILYFSPIMGSIMHGFSYSTDRWYFGVIFFLTVVSTISMDEKIQLEKRGYFVYYLISLISLLGHVFMGERNVGLFIRVLLFGILILILPIVWNYKKNRGIMLSGYAIICSLCTGIFVFGPKILGGSGYSANFKEIGVQQEIIGSIETLALQDNSFERWDIYGSSYGASLLGNFNGTAEYFSIINGNISRFYQEMYISPGVRVASFILRGLDGRQEIESLLAVSQYMDFVTIKKEVATIVKENKYFLPLGFMYDSYMTEADFRLLNPMQKASQVMEAVIVSDDLSGYTKIRPQLEDKNNYELNYQISSEDFNTGIKIYLDIEEVEHVIQESELYVHLGNLHGNAVIHIGSKDIELKDESYVYYTGEDDYWINITDIKEDDKGQYFEFLIDGETDFKLSKMSVYLHSVNYAGIKERKENSLKNITILNDRISGNIMARQDGVLFLSIPYNKGWKAYVNGEEADLLKANIGFMAIQLEEGDYKIDLKYEAPGFKVGLGCSIISLFTLIVTSVMERKRIV